MEGSRSPVMMEIDIQSVKFFANDRKCVNIFNYEKLLQNSIDLL